MKLNRENLLQVYCLLRRLNGKDKASIYWQLVDIFGKGFILRWESLFATNESRRAAYREKWDNDLVLPTLKLDELERMAILQSLEESLWVQNKAAEKCGISARSMNYRIGFYGIKHSAWNVNNED